MFFLWSWRQLNQTICLLPFSSCDCDTHHWLQTYTHTSSLADHEQMRERKHMHTKTIERHPWLSSYIHMKTLRDQSAPQRGVYWRRWNKSVRIDPMQKRVFAGEVSVCVDSICVISRRMRQSRFQISASSSAMALSAKRRHTCGHNQKASKANSYVCMCMRLQVLCLRQSHDQSDLAPSRPLPSAARCHTIKRSNVRDNNNPRHVCDGK